MIRNWYAVYTKTQQEQKVTAALAKKGINAYCPLTRVGVYRGFGKKINLQPLLPSFVFVHITENEFAAVRQSSDVINFMYWLGRPAIIAATEIKGIQLFTATHQNLKVEKTAIIRNATAPVAEKIIEQSFNGLSGTQKTFVKLSLPSLGYILVAETAKPAGIFDYTYETDRVL